MCSQNVIYANVFQKSSTLLEEGGEVYAVISFLSSDEGYTFYLQGLSEQHNVISNNLRKPLVRRDDQLFGQHIGLGYIYTFHTHEEEHAKRP